MSMSSFQKNNVPNNGPRIIECIIHWNDKWNNGLDSFSLGTRSQLGASTNKIYIYRIDTIISNFSSPIISTSCFVRLELESRISMEKLFAKVFQESSFFGSLRANY